MRSRFNVLTFAAMAAAASTGGAQQRTAPPPAIRQLGPIVAKTTETFSSIAGVRPLSTGGVLVNDISGRKVVLYDPSLAKPLLVADTTSATASAYAGQTAGLIAYRGDSTIFVDPSSMSMLIVDANGKIARVMSVPRTQDAVMLAGPLSTSVGFDPAGQLIYRGSPFAAFGAGAQRQVQRADGGGPGGFTPPEFPDSLPIVRIDLATRKLDTLAYGKIPKVKLNIEQSEGRFTITTVNNPLPTVDDFAVLPDGTLAMVRGSDFHVDYYAPDGTKTSAPKIGFEWQRLTDEDKVAFIDSVKAVRARTDSAIAARGGNAAAVAAGVAAGVGGGGGGGAPNITIIGGPGGGGGGPRGGGGGGGGGRGGPRITFVSPSELPDYKPAFFAGSTKADTEGNLWIRTIPTKKIEGGPVYSVIDRKGALVDRVQVPVNTTIIGFGADGSVYLSQQNGTTFTLEKAKLR